MVMVTKTENSKRGTVTKRRLFCTTCLGVILLLTPIALLYFDPVLYIVQHKLRVENGSMVNELLLSRFTSTRINLYLFNITNAERFLSGADEKIHLEDIGPFVYQEYRTNEDLEINKDPGIMRYTPQMEPVFIPEESFGDPKDITVTVPNIAMLSAAALISKYPFLVRQVFNMIVTSSRSQAFVTLNAYDHIWGYSDPLIQLANNAVPGLIYFKKIGLLERLYDIGVDYRLELGTRNSDKFSVKRVTRIQPKGTSTGFSGASIDNTHKFNNTYEGAAFPPNITPEAPISIYRHGLCKTFRMQYRASKDMPYGGVGFVYQFHNETFNDRKQCDTKGWCPEGLKSLAECYFGFPIALSKGYFLDSDPRLLEMVEGVKPDRMIHDTHMVIDPKIGVAVSGSMTLQLNLALDDLNYSPQARRLKDTVLPISNIIVKSPPMIEEVKTALHLLYKQGPYMILAAQVACSLLGALLFFSSARMMYWSWMTRGNMKQVKKAQCPLLTQ